MANPRIVVDFVANTRDLTQGMNSATGAASGFGSRMKSLGRATLAAAGAAGIASLAVLQRLTTWAVPTPPTYAATMPLGMAVMSAAAIRGALERLAGRGPRWRGRRYPLAR